MQHGGKVLRWLGVARSPASSGVRSAGSIELEANAAREGSAGFKAKLDGSARGLRTCIAAGDALLGGSVTMTGSMQRDPAGLAANELHQTAQFGECWVAEEFTTSFAWPLASVLSWWDIHA